MVTARQRPWSALLRPAVFLPVLAVVCGLIFLANTLRTTGASPETPGSGTAAQTLGALPVAAEHSMKGYSRDRFPHWRSTGRGCDVRDAVLQRDGKDVKIRGCNVTGGRWSSRYDLRTITTAAEVDVDHMVPLANAWRSGADAWTDDKRSDFANDLTRPQLFAVSRAANRAKGDQNPAQWKPSNRGDWCRYATDWITVKAYWKLTITAAERTALTQMLETCR